MLIIFCILTPVTKNYRKILTNWLNANKIALNSTKTELIYFRKKRTSPPVNNKIILNGKRLIPVDHIKYLGLYLDETLSGSL